MTDQKEARAEAERRWPLLHGDNRESGANSAHVGRQDAFLAGVEWVAAESARVPNHNERES